MKKIKCRAERRWDFDLVRWEGIIITPNGERIGTGFLRIEKRIALQDARRMAEELEHGVTSR